MTSRIVSTQDLEEKRVVPRVIKFDAAKGAFITLEALEVASEQTESELVRILDADDLAEMLDEVAQFLVDHDFTNLFGLALKLNTEEDKQMERESQNRGYLCEYSMEVSGCPESSRQVIVSQIYPDSSQAEYRNDFTTTYFEKGNLQLRCMNCVLGSDDEGEED